MTVNEINKTDINMTVYKINKTDMNMTVNEINKTDMNITVNEISKRTISYADKPIRIEHVCCSSVQFSSVLHPIGSWGDMTDDSADVCLMTPNDICQH